MKFYDDILNNRKLFKYFVYFCGGKKYGCGGYGNWLGVIILFFYLVVIMGCVFFIDWKSIVFIVEYF